MKKSILALGALTVVGGLCLAGSAQAVWYFGDGNNVADTTSLDLNPGSMGNELIVPYFSAQGATHTNIDIVNTDQSNGKAVKVRFRGAANSDDVLDFTVLMSPGDVWNADISQGPNGLAHIVTQDKTCTLPSGPISTDFISTRMPSYLGALNSAANTLEGYVEILNMADIPPKTLNVPNNANALYDAIKHKSGQPACAADWVAGANAGSDALEVLLDTVNPGSGLDLLNDYGLDAPTGGLTGGWALINQTNFAAFSANDTAVRADGGAFSQVAIAPQIQGPAAAGLGAASVTADPLLTGNSVIPPVALLQWYDIPDLSTPMLSNVATPTLQADTLAFALGKTGFNDEYINDANGPTPMSTDLVFSQPTRRYFAVVDYGSNAATARIIYNDSITSGAGLGGALGRLPYAGNTANATTPLPAAIGAGNLALTSAGPVACLLGIQVKSYDQEETTASTAASFSPGVTNPQLCGEVATMTWGNSPLSASLTNTKATTSYKSGWVAVGLPVGTGAAYGLPALGFSAINAMNGSQGYGITWGIRW